MANLWTEKDLTVLREYYETTPGSRFSVKAIANALGRSESAITLKASRLGITNKSRHVSEAARKNMKEAQLAHFAKPENRERMSRQVKESIKRNGHPKGMLGKHHTDKTKRALSEASTKAMKDMSPEQDAERVLKGLKTRRKNGTLVPPRNKTTWKAGWRNIGGKEKYYRSRWEANYARYLQWLLDMGEIVEWEHEPDTFWFENIRRGVRSYLPDFKVKEKCGRTVYHEVKGWMDKRSKTKIKRMARYYPEVELIIIATKEYHEIEKKVSGLISDWEKKKR